jgi:hypothetical protein
MDDPRPASSETHDQDPLGQDQEHFQILTRAARFTAIAGTVFSLLTMVSFGLLPAMPGPGATVDDLTKFADSSAQSAVRIVALYLMPFACIAFVWFIVALRMWIPHRSSRRVDILLSNIQLVSGIVFLVLFSAASAAMSISAVVVERDDGSFNTIASYAFPQYGSALFFVFAIRMGAMFVFSTSGIGKQTGVLPRWLVLLGYAVGLVMLLSASFNRALIFVFPVWTLLISVIIFIHARKLASKRLATLNHEEPSPFDVSPASAFQASGEGER